MVNDDRRDNSAERMIRISVSSDGSSVEMLPDGSTRPVEDRTDHARLAATPEDEIEANALADPDNPPMSDEELARFRPARSQPDAP